VGDRADMLNDGPGENKERDAKAFDGGLDGEVAMDHLGMADGVVEDGAGDEGADGGAVIQGLGAEVGIFIVEPQGSGGVPGMAGVEGEDEAGAGFFEEGDGGFGFPVPVGGELEIVLKDEEVAAGAEVVQEGAGVAGATALVGGVGGAFGGFPGGEGMEFEAGRERAGGGGIGGIEEDGAGGGGLPGGIGLDEALDGGGQGGRGARRGDEAEVGMEIRAPEHGGEYDKER